MLAIYLAKKINENCMHKIKKDLHMMLINLEKVCNKVLQKVLCAEEWKRTNIKKSRKDKYKLAVTMREQYQEIQRISAKVYNSEFTL